MTYRSFRRSLNQYFASLYSSTSRSIIDSGENKQVLRAYRRLQQAPAASINFTGKEGERRNFLRAEFAVGQEARFIVVQDHRIGPRMGSLKSPRGTSYNGRQYIDTIAFLYSPHKLLSFFSKTAFLRMSFRQQIDRQSDGQHHCIKPPHLRAGA